MYLDFGPSFRSLRCEFWNALKGVHFESNLVAPLVDWRSALSRVEQEILNHKQYGAATAPALGWWSCSIAVSRLVFCSTVGRLWGCWGILMTSGATTGEFWWRQGLPREKSDDVRGDFLSFLGRLSIRFAMFSDVFGHNFARVCLQKLSLHTNESKYHCLPPKQGFFEIKLTRHYLCLTLGNLWLNFCHL